MPPRPRGSPDAECCGRWMMTVCAPCILVKLMRLVTQRIAFNREWTARYDPSISRLCLRCAQLLGFTEEFDSGSTYFTAGGRKNEPSSAEKWLYDPPGSFGGYNTIKKRAEACACSYGARVEARLKCSIDSLEDPSPYRFSFRTFYSLQGDINEVERGLPALVERRAVERPFAGIVKPLIDLDFARKAYEECRRGHDVCQARYESLLTNPDYMRLIDVGSLELVMAPQKCNYVTLSYVWGSVNNSVGVCRAMGIRYLWVDDICILETRAVSKVAQFGDMHRIYGNAQFTIIAAQGTNANEGLYGFRPNTRPDFDEQVSSSINEQISLVKELALPAPIQRSTWTTRGWCLQEQLLSKAFLVFWDNQVYWQCPGSMHFEDISLATKSITCKSFAEYEHLHPSPYVSSAYIEYLDRWESRTESTEEELDACRVSQLPLISNILNPHAHAGLMDRNTVIRANGSTLVVRPAVFEEYTVIVSRYSQRVLTHDVDALRAISGVLTVLENGFQSELLHGLPESHLDAALLWREKEGLERRCEDTLPSWSWAGWKGEVAYQDTVEIQTIPGRWTFEDPVRKMIKTRAIKDDLTTTEHFERLRPWAQWDTSCSSSLTTVVGEEFRLGDKMLLRLETKKKKKIVSWEDEEDEKNKENEEMKKGYPSFQIMGKDRVAGHLTLDSSMWLDRDSKNYEGIALVVLSEAQLFDDVQLNIDWDFLNVREDAFYLFNVMPVKLDTSTMVGTRMGIGKVTQDAFYEYDGLEWGGLALR
ncbi:Uu.00g067980.m01.CDS01 [Anthostomella pinea]|uniref:Uu.00g067980.m01.CDS01 n=1 Tax=Anthostomella pinea TaxID=933095 RepID=A0AAI8VVG0_9PEZI|nr:Uu.00g067980.m01.CDS01 [Anthostomella pinea]